MAKSRRKKLSRKKPSKKRALKRRKTASAPRMISQKPLPHNAGYPPAGQPMYAPGYPGGYPPQETLGDSAKRGVASGFGVGLGFGAANAAVEGIGSFFSDDDE